MAKNWITTMNSPARRETDSLLEELERRISKEYSKAAEEIQERANRYFERFKERDAANLQKVKDGLMTQEEYEKWRMSSMTFGSRYNTMISDLTNTAVNADKAAMAMVNGSLQNTFAINANYAAYEVERSTGVDTTFTLYNKDSVARLVKDDPDLLPKPRVDIPLDKRWNRQHISSALTQGILQGDSVDRISKRLQSVTDMDRKAAIRNARTMTTSAENAGKKHSYERAKAMGIDGKNMWLATHDMRTRESHAAMDGEVRDLDEKFSNGCAFPGDPAGDPEEVYNCRCSLVFVSKYSSFLQDYEEQNESLKIGDMSYEEWKAQHEEEGTITGGSYSATSIGDLTEPERPRRSNFENEDAYYAAREEYKAKWEEYLATIDNAVENSVNIHRFDDYEEISSWCNSLDITISDEVKDKIDKDAFNEFSSTLEEMFDRFPEVKNFSFETYDGSVFKTQFNIGITEDGLLSANNGINFNPNYFHNYSDGLETSLIGVASGWTVRGDGSFATLVRHEYGHNVQSYIEFKLSDKYHVTPDDWRLNFSSFNDYISARNQYQEKRTQYMQDLRELAGLSGSSEYSNTNTSELFAEGFAEWASGGKSEFAEKFGEFFKRWY